MESVHCYRCYRFPSKDFTFYITNCMHIFCVDCRDLCIQPDEVSDYPKCVDCEKSPIRLLKMGPDMPNQVKEMFTPITEDIQKITREMTRILTFQNRQRANLICGLARKEKIFDKLRNAHNEEKTKKELYKRKLEQALRLLKSRESELSQLKSCAENAVVAARTPNLSSKDPASIQYSPVLRTSKSCGRTNTETPPPIRVFSDSMYETPAKSKQQKSIEDRIHKLGSIPLSSKVAKSNHPILHPTTKQKTYPPPESFQTPIQPPKPPKTSMGFTTPANPPHMFPHLAKHEAFRNEMSRMRELKEQLQ